jgi:hypothetical protein
MTMGDGLAQPVRAALVDPTDVNPGDTSDAQVDKVRWFMDFMGGEVGGLYNTWCGHPCAADDLQYALGNSVRAMWDGNQEKTLINELRGINWGLIHDAQGRFDSLAKAAGAAGTSTTSGVNGIHSAWSDKAGAKAADKFNELAKPLQDYAVACDAISKAAAGLWQASRQPVYDLAALQPKTIPDMHNKYAVYDYKRKQELITYLNNAIKWGREESISNDVEDDTDGGTGPINPRDLRSTPGLVDINEGYASEIYADSFCREMDEFAMYYRNAMNSFRKLIDDAYNAVGKALEAFTTAMRQNLTPFDSLQAPGQAGSQDGNGQSSNGDSSDTGGSHRRSSSGGDQSSTSSYQPPPVQPPPMPVEPVTDPAGSTDATGSTDPTGGVTDPSGVDPSLDPSQDPGKGQPDPSQGQPETVTIEDGDRKISVTSPDSQGHVQLTVDDGTGQPKTYDMDFSGQQPNGSTPAGQFGPDGSQVSDANGAIQYGPDGKPMPANGATQLGPDGQPVTGGDGGVQHAQAGPDGKVVLHDGNVTITAEQQPPGSPDKVQLTIDDGSGKPATYVIDYGDPAQPQVAPGTSDPAQAQYQPMTEADRPAQHGFAGTGGSSEASGFAATGSASDASGFGGGAQQAEPLQSVPGSGDPVLATATQSVGLDFSGGSDAAMGDSTWSTQGDLLADGQEPVAPAAGDAGLAAVPDDGSGGAHHQAPAQGGAPMGGGMPMMGGGGAGGGGGGDQERGSSQWSTQGDLFDDGPSAAAARIQGVLNDDLH